MKQLLLIVSIALALSGGFVGCATHDSDNSPQPIRPAGSGGRGMSPGHAAETSTGPATSR